ncbi:hypothetical protein QBC44DRAFT_246120 [Cladorrhinum sp. PSN332]|nr:hypothetical protein QBC44DRAFT_246120 [Cladorrhinum sp. PSN332]
MSFRSLPDYSINDALESPIPTDHKQDAVYGKQISAESAESASTNSSNPDSDQPIDIITTLGVYPETKDQVEEHLIKLGKQIEEEEPDCLQWEVFYLNATGELVLIERFKNLAAAEYHWQMQYNQNVLSYLADQGWLSGHPDMKRLKSRGGFAFRSRLTNLN